jgi:hypothetical protein
VYIAAVSLTLERSTLPFCIEFYIIIFMEEFKKIIFRSRRIRPFLNAVRLPVARQSAIPDASHAGAPFSAKPGSSTLPEDSASMSTLPRTEQDSVSACFRVPSVSQKGTGKKVPNHATFIT